MKSNSDHFGNIAEFLGADWLKAGCQTLNDMMVKMVETGFVDNDLERSTHAVHRLWFTQVLGKTLPSDLIITGDYRDEHRLTQIHRLLTLEGLLDKLRSTWDSATAEDVRGKLRNTSDFESTLYELQVALNFRDAGHEVNLSPNPPKDGLGDSP